MNTVSYVEFYLIRRFNFVYSLLETFVYVHMMMTISGRNMQRTKRKTICYKI
jgi:hypothetical protein